MPIILTSRQPLDISASQTSSVVVAGGDLLVDQRGIAIGPVVSGGGSVGI